MTAAAPVIVIRPAVNRSRWHDYHRHADYIALGRQAAESVLPTLLSLRELLLVQPEPEARDLALSMELFTEGSLNAFAYPTNVNTNNRIVVYDILDLGEQLKTMGLLVITDAILNRVTGADNPGYFDHASALPADIIPALLLPGHHLRFDER